MRILLAIDDSPHSQSAAETVRTRPWPDRSLVRVLSVVRPFEPMANEWWYVPTVDTPAWEAQRTSRTEELVTRVGATLRAAGLDAGEVVRVGDPRTTIVDEATAWRADLIVVGSHGYTGIRRLLLGSVAQYVVSHADCSVEVVREKRS